MNSTITLENPVAPRPVGLSNGRLGMLLLIGSETVLFATFISAYLVLRMGAPVWPPAGTPVLTVGLSAINTGLLVISTILAFRFRHAMSRGLVRQAKQGVLMAALLGMVFLSLQGVEFHRLYARGLTLRTGIYGAIFYSLITCHGLHVLGGLGIFGVLLTKLNGSASTALEWAGHAELYWHFVTGVWLVLFTILYLL